MSTISPFRFVPEDLEGLDKKTRDGLQPLLDAINIFAQQTVAFAESAPQFFPTEGTFSTDGTGAATFKVRQLTPNKPRGLYLDSLRPTEEGEITAPYSFAIQFIGDGLQVTFLGLDNNTKYTFAMSMM